ncbi:NGK_0946 family protein [Haloferula sargassicola]|uniref:Lipoprotein n=1 Tax=Haloferula sargassicola TaxID=490096 RepID=A0ABP9UP91_9BACT
MKRHNTRILFSLAGAAFLLASCTTGGPTVASLGAGSDSAYLNASRGRADAQISEQQAQQYSRQRQQVAEEMGLEQQKRRNFFESTGSTLDILNAARTLVR